MNTLIDIFKKIYQLRLYILVFVIAFLFFFIVYFPREKVLNIIFTNITSQTGLEIIPVDPELDLFPTFGINFKSAQINTADKTTKLDLGETKIGIPLASVITFSPSVELSSKAFEGNVDAKILGLPIRPGKTIDEIYIDLESKGISLNKILKGQVIDVDAVMDLAVQGNLNLINTSYSDLDITSKLSNIQIKEGNIMGFPVPAVSLKTGEIAMAVAKNEILIAKMNIGSADDELNLSVKGTVSLKVNNPYDLNIKIKISGNLAQQFGSLLAMLPPQAKNSEGFYNIRVRGDKRSPIPQVTPLQ